MLSRILLLFFTFSISLVCSSRTMWPSPDNSPITFYLVHVDPALYHHDCMKYQQLLGKVLHERSEKDALIYCYKHVTSGFAAVLTEQEAETLKGETGISSVTKDGIYSPDLVAYDHGHARKHMFSDGQNHGAAS